MSPRVRYIGLHTLGAAAFIFVLQYFILDAGLDTAAFWSIGFAVMAGGLAYQQTRRWEP